MTGKNVSTFPGAFNPTEAVEELIGEKVVFHPDRATFRTEVVRDWLRLKELVPQWEALAENAIERNVFYEPFMVFPALEHLCKGQSFEFVFIFACPEDKDNKQEVLCGLFPLERNARFYKIPVKNLKLWTHIHCFLNTPLIHLDCPSDVIETFLKWLAEKSDSRLMKFNGVGSDGGFYESLVEGITRRRLPFWISRNYRRSAMRKAINAESYINRAISNGRRKEYRRQARRLGEAGSITYEQLSENGDFDAWLIEFLRIEGSGWKGENSSSLNSKDSYHYFFKEVAKEAFARNRLQMLAMRLDGRIIAQKCNFISGELAFCFKIGFDEKLRRYSPGVLLEIENIRRFHKEETLDWMDSCAEPNHPMIDHLWTERRGIQSMFIGSGPSLGNLLLTLAPLMRVIKNRMSSSKLLSGNGG